MSTIAELELPAAEFALYDTLTRVDGVRFEIERVIAHDSERIMPLVYLTIGFEIVAGLDSVFGRLGRGLLVVVDNPPPTTETDGSSGTRYKLPIR